MAALMHSNYRKVGFLLQNKQTKKKSDARDLHCTSLDDRAAEGSGKLTSCLANRTAHAACCAHVSRQPGTIPCSPCQPSFPIHLEGGTCPHAFTQRFSSGGRFQQGQPHHQQCSDHMLFKYMKMWVFQWTAGPEKSLSEMESSPAVPMSAECVVFWYSGVEARCTWYCQMPPCRYTPSFALALQHLSINDGF